MNRAGRDLSTDVAGCGIARSPASDCGADCDHDHGAAALPALNETQKRVLAILQAAPGPLSAYEVLDRMRQEKSVTPPTVYRALERLMNEGLAHRLESLNAYLACHHPHHHEVAAFAICRTCGAVTEFTDAAIETRLAGWSGARGFQTEKVTIELRGLCASCARPAATA